MKKAIKVTIALSANSDYKGLLMDNKHILLKGTLILTPVSYTHLDVYKRQIGARSFNAFAIGARQFVVQEAAEMILSSFVRVSSVSYTHLPGLHLHRYL